MAIQYSTSLRSAMMDAVVTAIGTSGTIKIYTGSAPATVGDAATGTLLGTLTFSSTMGTVSNGVLTANSITGDSSADATGTAGYFRATTSGGTAVLQGTCGTSGADLNLVTTSIVATQPINITSMTLTQGGA